MNITTDMVAVIQKQNKEFYQCEECSFQYAEKEWAEKCEAWCKEHKSCNLEIIARAIPEDDDLGGDEPKGTTGRKLLTRFFYGLIGTAASLAFFLALYWALRLDSSITSVITSTYDTPLYFWPYVVLTLGAIALFGVNASLFVYRSRKFGRPKLRKEAGTGLGSLVGILSSACPVCGSTILYALGVFGGLAVFPLQGLELKALSFGLMALPVWLMRRDLKKLECGDGTCPVPKDHRFKESDRSWLFALLAVVIGLLFISWNLLKTEPIIARILANRALISPSRLIGVVEWS